LHIPDHHERSKVCNTQVTLYINGCVDDKSNKSEQEAKCNKGESSGPVTAKREDQQHCCTGNVGCHRVEIRLDGAVTKTFDDDWKEELDSLERHAKTNLNGQNGPAGPVLEDSEGIPNIQFLAHDRGTVDLEAQVCKLLLLGSQETGFRG
jgi:hypothetical protein